MLLAQPNFPIAHISDFPDGHPYHGQRGVFGVDEVLVERLDLPVRQPQGNILGHETHVVLVPRVRNRVYIQMIYELRNQDVAMGLP